MFSWTWLWLCNIESSRRDFPSRSWGEDRILLPSQFSKRSFHSFSRTPCRNHPRFHPCLQINEIPRLPNPRFPRRPAVKPSFSFDSVGRSVGWTVSWAAVDLTSGFVKLQPQLSSNGPSPTSSFKEHLGVMHEKRVIRAWDTPSSTSSCDHIRGKAQSFQVRTRVWGSNHQEMEDKSGLGVGFPFWFFFIFSIVDVCGSCAPFVPFEESRWGHGRSKSK